MRRFRSTSDHNLEQSASNSDRRSASLEWKRRSDARRMRTLCRLRTHRFKPNSPSAPARSIRRRRRLLEERAAPSNDPRRKVGPQPLPSDGDLADRGAYRRPKRPTGIRRAARHGQGRHRRDPARRILSAATATSRRKKRGLKCSWPRSIVPEIPRGLRADRPHDGLRSQGARP